MKKVLAIVLLLSLSACSQGLDGVYRDAMGLSSYHFHSDGQLTITVAGTPQAAHYVRDGQHLQIVLADGRTLSFQIGGDGALLGPLGVRLDKAAD